MDHQKFSSSLSKSNNGSKMTPLAQTKSVLITAIDKLADVTPLSGVVMILASFPAIAVSSNILSLPAVFVGAHTAASMFLCRFAPNDYMAPLKQRYATALCAGVIGTALTAATYFGAPFLYEASSGNKAADLPKDFFYKPVVTADFKNLTATPIQIDGKDACELSGEKANGTQARLRVMQKCVEITKLNK